jgi:predicted site-specific integrase-resolvase
MDRLVSIGEAAEALEASITTLRRWEAAGKFVSEHTAGGHRRYDLAKLRPELFRATNTMNRKTVTYARIQPRPERRAGTPKAGA